ncbi:MAG: class A beta-lactamase-related serine hydrolase [Chitinophagaceae bacterium]|nr:MAG: class A beta-lactamase-related serine hydrolase [Chitinophagaceae bacterium]
MQKLSLLLLLPFFFACSKKSGTENPPPPPLPPEPQTQKDIASIDNAVQGFMTTYAIPGVSVAITKGEKLVYAKSYGKMGGADNNPVTNNSLYRIASVSKPVTGIGIMKLLEGGKLTLDSKVFGPGSILGADFPTAPAGVHDITVRHLLHHTVGAWGNDGNDPMFKQQTFTHTQLINWTLANYPATSGRGTYRYSNFGYSLLGRVIEKLSGKTYEQYIKEDVLAPAGITAMTIGGNTLADRKPGEVVYTGQNNFSPYVYNVTRMDAHGGWLASATDLARLAVRVDGFTGKADILKPATITTMTTPSNNSGYAGGWLVNSANNWWHTGGIPGTAALIVRTASGYTWTVLCNSRSYNANFDTALDNLLWPVVNNPATPWQNIDQF